VKKRDLLILIREAAEEHGKSWTQVATSRRGDHEKWRLGAGVQVSIPRHRFINEITARQILKATESELGEAWWE
jgi:hypothetical protein